MIRRSSSGGQSTTGADPRGGRLAEEAARTTVRLRRRSSLGGESDGSRAAAAGSVRPCLGLRARPKHFRVEGRLARGVGGLEHRQVRHVRIGNRSSRPTMRLTRLSGSEPAGLRRFQMRDHLASIRRPSNRKPARDSSSTSTTGRSCGGEGSRARNLGSVSSGLAQRRSSRRSASALSHARPGASADAGPVAATAWTAAPAPLRPCQHGDEQHPETEQRPAQLGHHEPPLIKPPRAAWPRRHRRRRDATRRARSSSHPPAGRRAPWCVLL